MTLTGVMNTVEVLSETTDTLKPLAGTGTTRESLFRSMKLLGAVAALVAFGNTSVGVEGADVAERSGARVTQTLDVALPDKLKNSA